MSCLGHVFVWVGGSPSPPWWEAACQPAVVKVWEMWESHRREMQGRGETKTCRRDERIKCMTFSLWIVLFSMGTSVISFSLPEILILYMSIKSILILVPWRVSYNEIYLNWVSCHEIHRELLHFCARYYSVVWAAKIRCFCTMISNYCLLFSRAVAEFFVSEMQHHFLFLNLFWNWSKQWAIAIWASATRW